MGLYRGSVPTFLLRLSTAVLDEGEDEEDDEGGHADPSERLCSTCDTNTRKTGITSWSLNTSATAGVIHSSTYGPSGRTKVVDEHSSHHGSTAAAQPEVEALQDALRRRPQRRRDRRTQEGDTGGPDWGVGHTWRTRRTDTRPLVSQVS